MSAPYNRGSQIGDEIHHSSVLAVRNEIFQCILRSKSLWLMRSKIWSEIPAPDWLIVDVFFLSLSTPLENVSFISLEPRFNEIEI